MYVTPDFELVLFAVEDIMTASGASCEEDICWTDGEVCDNKL